MEAEEYEKIFTFINDGTYIEGKKLFNSYSMTAAAV
jgi:hypothetical protein